MNSERIILANYENIQIANYYADLLSSGGIACSVEGIRVNPDTSKPLSPPVLYILKVSSEDEGISRIILQSDDPWFLPQIQAPIGHQYRLIGAILIFVGLLCAFLSLGTPQVKWIGFPLIMALIGIFTFAIGIRRSASDFDKE